MWSSTYDSYNYLASRFGYIFIEKFTDNVKFEIATIVTTVRASLCGDHYKLYTLKKPIVFFGEGEYNNSLVIFKKKPINNRLRYFLMTSYPDGNNGIRLTDKFISKITFSFKEAHPNVSSTDGSLCPGTLGHLDPAWPSEQKARYLTRLIPLLSIPNFDSAMFAYGCKAYKKLKKYLSTELSKCLGNKCKY